MPLALDQAQALLIAERSRDATTMLAVNSETNLLEVEEVTAAFAYLAVVTLKWLIDGGWLTVLQVVAFDGKPLTQFEDNSKSAMQALRAGSIAIYIDNPAASSFKT
jgi:hypothetical protein